MLYRHKIPVYLSITSCKRVFSAEMGPSRFRIFRPGGKCRRVSLLYSLCGVYSNCIAALGREVWFRLERRTPEKRVGHRRGVKSLACPARPACRRLPFETGPACKPFGLSYLSKIIRLSISVMVALGRWTVLGELRRLCDSRSTGPGKHFICLNRSLHAGLRRRPLSDRGIH